LNSLFYYQGGLPRLRDCFLEGKMLASDCNFYSLNLKNSE
jgi:hypothetical protein